MRRPGRPRGRRAYLVRAAVDEATYEEPDLLEQERAMDQDELRGQLRALQAGTLMSCMAARRAGI